MTEAMQALVDGQVVFHKGERVFSDNLPEGTIILSGILKLPHGAVIKGKTSKTALVGRCMLDGKATFGNFEYSSFRLVSSF